MSLKVFFVLFIVYFASDYSYGQRDKKFFRKDYFYLESTSNFYKIHTLYLMWRDAKRMCEWEDAKLFYPENVKEANAVLSYWKSKQPFRWIFVGISDLRTEGVFETIDGLPVSDVYNNWSPGEPNDSGGVEDCVVLSRDDGKLNDDNCSKKLPFICKKTLVSLEGNQPSEIPNLGSSSTESSSNNNGNVELTLQNYVFLHLTNALYKLHKTPKSFEDAKRTCEHENATLFYPETASESSAVKSLFLQEFEENLPHELIMGLQRVDENGFETIDGIPESYVHMNWRSGEPNGATADDVENCVVLVKPDWVMADVDCARRFSFICKSRITRKNGECQVSNFSYVYNEEMGKCYKFHLTPKTWVEAQATCRDEESHLAVINSPEEAAYLVRLTRRALQRDPGRFTHGVALLGFYKIGENWQTVHGTSLHYSGYACWGNEQPDGADHDRCGSMFYNGHLNDIGCGKKAFFICEYENVSLDYQREPPSFYNVLQSLRCHDTI